MNLFNELKRRNVFKVAIAYAENPNLQPIFRSTLKVYAAFLGADELLLQMLNGTEVGSVFSSLRTSPEYKEKVLELGLVNYWRDSGNWSDYCQPLPDTESDFECYR